MHVAILDFRLRDLTHEQFLAKCDELAPALANVPGLISKVFLADRATNTYGGVYTWADKASLEAFARGDLGKAIASNPNLAELTIKDYAVLDGPTRVTRGLR
jgi:hypothetical protein